MYFAERMAVPPQKSFVPSLPAPLSPFQEKRGTFLFTFTYPCREQSLYETVIQIILSNENVG